MVRYHFLKFIFPAFCSFSATYSVIPKIPLLDANDPLTKEIKPLNNSYYKGIHLINEYGWCITQKWDTPLQRVERSNKWYDVKAYSPHPHLGFAIFKVNVGRDHMKSFYPTLKYLANKEDLQSNANWVSSLAFVPDPLSQTGKISGKREVSTKPLSVISKIESQENGYLQLSPGGSAEAFYQETCPKAKQKISHTLLMNTNHIKSLLERPNYQSEFLTKNIDLLAKKKIQDLTNKKEKYKKDCKDAYSAAFPNTPLPEQVVKEIDGSFVVQNLDHIIQELNSDPQKRQLILWEDHQKELNTKRDILLKNSNILNTSSDSYTQIPPELQRMLKQDIVNYFRNTHLGVANREDNGGLIVIKSKDLTLGDNGYDYSKVAGITCVREGDDLVEGEWSIAIDLTTQEVHDWISQKIDSYYNPHATTDKGKRTADDSGPSEKNKKPCIKQESTEDNLATNPNNNNVQVKEEVKEEAKQDDLATNLNNNNVQVKEEIKGEVKQEF